MTDSSYDSLENELDDSSGGSPGVCSRRPLQAKPLQGSLDSILTLSDYDQDTDPDVQHTQPGRTQDADVSCFSQAGSNPDSLRPDARHRQRRRSEPAIAYVAKFQACVSGGADEELPKKSSSQNKGGGDESGLKLRGGGAADLEASSSSLSSTPNSPAPTRSSLDSLSSDLTWATRRGRHPAKVHVLPDSPGSSSGPSTSVTAGPTVAAEHPDVGTHPKDSPPKEPLNWGTLKSCRGLHPNSWLKKDRRLSLTQQDNLEKEDEDKTGVSRTISARTHRCC